MSELGKFQKARFYISVSAVYALTLIFALSSFDIGMFKKEPVYANSAPVVPVAPTKAIVVAAGKPVRVIVPNLGIDLPVDEGVYDEANKTWTLLGNHAYFAMPSVVANDYQGNTFIYGHNNPDVFGKLKAMESGDPMQLITDNGLKFHYVYESAEDLQPEDTSPFTYDGAPTAIIQTCVGSWNELRRIYHFRFDRVEKATP